MLKAKPKFTHPAILAASNGKTSACSSGKARVPQGDSADLVKSFLARGGQVTFFPPVNPDETEFAGVHWQAWENPETEVSVETWRGDQDLLSATNSGGALPVGDLHVRRYCHLAGDFTSLATLHGGAPLLTPRYYRPWRTLLLH